MFKIRSHDNVNILWCNELNVIGFLFRYMTVIQDEIRTFQGKKYFTVWNILQLFPEIIGQPIFIKLIYKNPFLSMEHSPSIFYFSRDREIQRSGGVDSYDLFFWRQTDTLDIVCDAIISFNNHMAKGLISP